MEAINSDKSWEEIKYLQQLKLCNTNIHTYTSHFMDIQWQEKESLAAYIHRFKTEAKRFNFTNDAATIRNFVKGLKNAHSLATHIYEKGPQKLTDAILEVEKLNAAQQLMAMIIPPSRVNVMLIEEDCYFQCQEPGHITWHCPHIRCYECGEYGHIIMDCPHRIPPSGTPVTHHKLHKSHHARSSLRHHHEDRDRWCQSRSQSHLWRHHSLSHCNLHRGHSRSQHWDRCNCHRSSSGWSHSAHRGHSHRPCCETLHQSHCRSSQHQGSSGYQSRDHSRSHSWDKATSQEEHEGEDWRPTHWLLQLWWSLQCLRIGIRPFKLLEPSPSSDSFEQGGLPSNDQVTVALITDCPTIMIHAGKCYKALIDLGAAISHIRYSTYQAIDSSFKTPKQATTTKLNTADGSPMTVLGITALHLRIGDFKLLIISLCVTDYETQKYYLELIPRKKFTLSYAWDKKKNCYIQKESRFLTYTRNCEQNTTIGIVKSTLKIPPRHNGIIPIKIKGHTIEGHMAYFISD